MNKTTRFAETVIKLRSAQGFANAFSFYKKRGGPKVFRVAFANYLNVEKGTCLPRGDRLAPLINALGVAPESVQARELLIAFLTDLTGAPELTTGLNAPAPADPAPAEWRVAENASEQAIGQRRVQISLEQYSALADAPHAYACHAVLANTKGGLSRKELAAMTGLTPKALEVALKTLERVKLAKTVRGSVMSPLAGKFVTPPQRSATMERVYARLRKHRQEWLKRGEDEIQSDYLILRAPRAKFTQYLPHLARVVDMSAIYGDVAPAPDSEIYLVEGRVSKLFSV